MNLLRIIVVTIIFTTFANRAFSVDRRFEACEPQTCGNGPNISYPFWLSGKQESCGYQSFKITCNEKYPVFSISDDDYIIREIFYSNHSFVLANAAVYDDNCPLPQHNFTLDRTPFNYSSDHVNFSFFYDCPKDPSEFKLSYPIDCASNGSHHSFATFHKGLVERMNYSLDSCQSSVHLPFDGAANVDALMQMNYTEILKMGFILNWTAQNCSTCNRSGGRCGFDDNEFVCFCSDRPHVKTCDDDNNTWNWKRKVIVGAALSAGSGLIMIYIIVCCIKARNQIFKRSNNQYLEAFIRTNGPLAVKRYKFLEIRKMTNSFKDKLGQGGYGDVYKGNLLDGSPVAVKVLKASKGSGEDFINEVASISRTSHVNVVTLLGYCFEGQKKALIYEFMPNGSLEKYTYNENALQTSNPQLEVEQLLDIVTGIARGLEYLHRGCNTRILHFDIKPHNILLDENFCPKISDFGLSKLFLKNESIMSMLDARGTIGYIAPEVFCRNFGGVSVKSDVYSYGMMVLELVGGRKNINARASHTSDVYFPDWVYKKLEAGSSLGLPNGVTEEENELARKMILVGLWCIQTKPSDRPSMSRVIEMLQGSIEALQIPPKPVLTFPVRTPPESSTLSLTRSFRD